MADAAEKLRLVLDYVPCEACLAQPVDDQELLCSICRRLDRQIAVSIAVKTTVLLDRPTEAGPVVIAPPGAGPGAPVEGPRVGVEILVEEIVEEPVVAVAAEPEFDDLVSFEPPSDVFEYTPPPPRATIVEEIPVTPPPEEAPPPQDDYVFRPPPIEEAPPPVRTEEPVEEWLPADEVPLAPRENEPNPWAPPPEEPAPIEEAEPVETVVDEDPILESTLVEEEEEIIETTPVEEEVLEATIVEDEEPAPEPPAPASGSDLWRLRGFDSGAEQRLAGVNVKALSHLAGHDPGELAARSGLSASRLAPWIAAADLVEEVGVPVDAAVALVAAGIEGPRGLRDSDAQSIVDKVQAFGGASVALSDVKRWKRRA